MKTRDHEAMRSRRTKLLADAGQGDRLSLMISIGEAVKACATAGKVSCVMRLRVG